jgi:DnaK suppressor protein
LNPFQSFLHQTIPPPAIGNDLSLTLTGSTPTISDLLLANLAVCGALVMEKKRLENYRKKLQAKREDLVRNIARVEEEGRAADEDTTVDLADKAANSYTKEFLFGQTNTERSFLALIDDALRRMKAGTYGLCANCEDEVQQKRLDAVPWAKYCIDCQEKQERGQL